MRMQLIVAATILLLASGPVAPAQQSSDDRATRHQHHHYKLIDIGTFGGPNASFFGFTRPINERGVATGCADSSQLDPNFVIQNPYFSNEHIQDAYVLVNGVRTRLQTLAGGTNACTQWINAQGVVVGASDVRAIDPLTGLEQIRAVLWDRKGDVHDLGTLGGNGSVAWVINDAGQVAGNALNDTPDAFNGSGDFGMSGATQTHAFLWQKGVIQDLGTLGGPDSGPYAMNQRGQVVGLSATNSIANPTTGLPTTHPFFWDGSKMIDLGSLGGTYGVAVDVNNRGQVIGNSNVAGDGRSRAFLWPGRDDKMIELPTLGGTRSEAKAINDEGDVTGASRLAGDAEAHAVLWSRGQITDLGVVPGDLCAEGMALNSKRQVVGFSNHNACRGDHSHGFLWEEGVLYDLNQLVSNSTTLTVIEGVRINDRGEIAGNAVTAYGDHRAVLLIPCDEAHPNANGCEYDAVDDSVAAMASSATLQSHSRPSSTDIREQKSRRGSLNLF